MSAWPELELEASVRFPVEGLEPQESKPAALSSKKSKRGSNVISERALHSDRLMAAITYEMETYLPHFLYDYFDFPSDFKETHQTVGHVVQQLIAMFGGGKHVATWATDHAKSMTADFFFPILSLMANPDESHIIVGANINDSKRRLQTVQRELETNHKLIRDYPWLKKPPPKTSATAWSRTELTVSGRSANKPNPSIYAGAVGSNDIRGRRGKLIIDDAEGEEHRHFPQKRKALYDFVKLEGVRCYEDKNESDRPLLIALGTPFDPDSIYFSLEREGWLITRVPAYTVDWPTIYKYRRLAGTWEDWAKLVPSKYFTWPLKREKILSQDPNFGKGLTKAQFSIAYLLDPSAGDPTRLSLEQIERLVKETEFPEAKDWKTFVSIDPASGIQSRFADYCGISVVRLRWPRDQKLPEVQVLECHQFEQGIIEQVKFAGDLALQYNCDVMFESNAQQKGNYRDIFKHFRPATKLVEFFTKQESKWDTEMGLTIIRTLVRSQKLQVPQSQLESEGVQSFMREIRDLGGEKHDHISCSVWFPVRWFYEQVRGLNNSPLVAGGIHNPFSQRMFANKGVPSFQSWRRR